MFVCFVTQGVALGKSILPFQGVRKPRNIQEHLSAFGGKMAPETPMAGTAQAT